MIFIGTMENIFIIYTHKVFRITPVSVQEYRAYSVFIIFLLAIITQHDSVSVESRYSNPNLPCNFAFYISVTYGQLQSKYLHTIRYFERDDIHKNFSIAKIYKHSILFLFIVLNLFLCLICELNTIGMNIGKKAVYIVWYYPWFQGFTGGFIYLLQRNTVFYY